MRNFLNISPLRVTMKVSKVHVSVWIRVCCRVRLRQFIVAPSGLLCPHWVNIHVEWVVFLTCYSCYVVGNLKHKDGSVALKDFLV